MFKEKVSGTVPWRKRKIAEILEGSRKGDTIILSELSRLGRSMLECMEILSIATQKGINIYAVKGDWQLTNSLAHAGARRLRGEFQGALSSNTLKRQGP